MSQIEAQEDVLTEDKNAVYTEADIYNEYTKRSRYLILLLVSSVTFLLPLSDTIYLPSLPTIKEDLNTTYTNVSLTIALYTIAIGVLPLLWGPLADYLGRKKTSAISLIIFVGSCVGCMLAKDIATLIVFRIIQGMGISAVLIVSTSAIADTWVPEQRGTALGLWGIPLLVGPVVGPVIGGAVAQEFTWRGTFVVLIVMGAIGVLLSVFVQPETMPYLVFNKIVAAKNPGATNPFPKPVFLAPWKPLLLFGNPKLLIISLGAGLCFCGFFVMMVMLPDVFSSKYGLNEANTGLCFLPVGFGTLLGSPLGGKLVDKASFKLNSPSGGLLVTLFGLFLMIPSLIANGWYISVEGPLAGLLVLNAVVGFCFSFSFPGIQSYAVALLPTQAGVALGLIQLAMFGLAGVMSWACTELVEIMGYGWMFTMFALAEIPTATAVLMMTVQKMKADNVKLW